MKNKTIYYTLICLVTLILTSIIYIINHDNIYEFVATNEEQSDVNISRVFQMAQDIKEQKARDDYNTYWLNVLNSSSENISGMNKCEENYNKFVESTADSLGELIKNEPSCEDYRYNGDINLRNNFDETGVRQLFSMDLADTTPIERLKERCLKNVFKGAGEIKDKIKAYKENIGMKDKCDYLAIN